MDDRNPLKMKVTELKSELGKRGLSQTGLKFDLAQRLQTAMDVDEFGALPSLASPSPSVPCLTPSSNPNGPPASSVDDDQTDSLLPVAATVQGSPNHEVTAPQRSTAESTCSPNSRENETLASMEIHEGEMSSFGASPGESIGVMWGGDVRSKKLSRNVAGEEHAAISATPTKRNKEPIGKERTKDGAEKVSETQKLPCPGSAERTRSAPAVIGELCAEMVYQLQTDEDRGGDSERTTSSPTKNKVEPVTQKPIELAEVPKSQCAAERVDLTSLRKPRSNVDGAPKTAHELDKTVIGRSERRRQSKGDERAGTGGRRTAELTNDSSGVASQDGCTDLVHTTPPDLSPGEPFFVSPFSEIDKMKDREERFGQPNKTNHPDCSKPSCSGNNMRDDGRCGRGRMGEGTCSETAYLDGADTVTANDTWKEKLLKRKARFDTPPLDRSRMKMTSERTREDPRPAASEAAAKMARRAERFQANSSGSSAGLVTAPGGLPDPRGGSFASSESVKVIVTPQKSAAGGNADDPSPQRRKRIRARNSALGTMLATAKRSALGKPSTVAGAPDKGNADTRGAPKRKKSMKQRVRFLPVVPTRDGGNFIQGGCSPSPSPRPRVAALASSPPSPSSLSPSFISPRVPHCFERVGVMPRSFSTKGCKTPPKRAGKGYMDKKAADQASKMRDRQKRFAQDSRTVRESTAC